MKGNRERIDEFFAAQTAWRDELVLLRKILLDSPLVEEFKWSSPVYTYGGGNVAILWGFKDRATIGFFKGVLLRDPEGILEAPGPNSRSSRCANFTDAAEIERLAPVLGAYVHEAIEIERSGAKVDLPKDDLDYPDELVDRLDSDPQFRHAFELLTPGRRRGWVLHFSQPKMPATRHGRIEKALARILAGKGMHDH
ncbi:YdeI/OmpD-associated family protein [Paracoccus sp. MBLB3053]|uniref:YdeI/OmpD-associated family protein n=1 Tax=Paracoccus aurantius TaxID=3073814 RepID=A0ABU2I000_9RHOB|nr:DUF1801 domain-containing protein [Paracoccus sp. MBLB3053]MDS9470115.1 YdeI/OmpD-associated family protein [Paracoccus sp. MBLB3053]